jgi:hypothetical protein
MLRDFRASKCRLLDPVGVEDSMVRLVSLLLAVALLLALPAGVLAKKPLAGCPAAASGFVHVDRDGW